MTADPWVFRTSPSAEHSFKVVCSDTLQPVRVQAIIAMRTHFNWTKGGLKQQWNLISRNTPKACLENLNTQVAFAKSKSTTVELIVAPLLPWSLKLHPSFVQAHPTFKPQVEYPAFMWPASGSILPLRSWCHPHQLSPEARMIQALVISDLYS
jgi:hypothetical protein